jgi:hypothetical protein
MKNAPKQEVDREECVRPAMVLRVLVVAMTSINPIFTAYPYNRKENPLP